MIDLDILRDPGAHIGSPKEAVKLCTDAAEEIERLRAIVTEISCFASVMAANNWRDIQLHIERQCERMK